MKTQTEKTTKDGLPIFEYQRDDGTTFEMVPYNVRFQKFKELHPGWSLVEHLEKHDNTILVLVQLWGPGGDIEHHGCWGSAKLTEPIKNHVGMASIRSQHSLFDSLGIGVHEGEERMMDDAPETAMKNAQNRLKGKL